MIIVTGQGRSGTSIVTKLLREAGLDTMGENRWDDKSRAGMEHAEIVAVNKVIFEINGKTRYYSTDWLTPKESMFAADKLKPLLLHYSNIFKGKLVKDPLFIKTLHVWIAAGCEPSAVVFCLRDAWKSALSANETSKGFSPVTTFSLEQIYAEMLARRGQSRELSKRIQQSHFVFYESLKKDMFNLIKLVTKKSDEEVTEILDKKISISTR